MTGDIDLGITGLSDYREIGSGGFAAVYEARDEFGRTVAVKVINAVDEGAKRRFDRERAAMGHVAGHGNIVTPFTSGYTNPGGKPFVVMEHLGGGSLQDVLDRDGPMSVDEAIGYVIAVADALAYSHRAGIVHKDVKPANILLTSEGVPKLTDFGIASVRDATQTASVAYSLDFTPPETFHGSADHDGDPRDERADLYSLAATLYTLVTGRGPFHSESNATPAGYMARILTESVPATGNPGLDGFLATAMAKDPTARYPSATDFSAALQQLHHGAPPATPAANVAPPEAATPPVTPAVHAAYPPATPAAPAYPPGVPGAHGAGGAGVTRVAGTTDPGAPTIAEVSPGTSPGAGPKRGRGLVLGAVAVAALLVVGALAWRLALNGGDSGGDSDSGGGDTAADAAGATDTGATDEGTTSEADGAADGGDATAAASSAAEDATSLADLPPSAGGDRTIRVGIVGNPNMEEIAELTPDLFTAETGITVDYTVLEPQAIAQIVTGDGEFDAVMVGMFEAPQLGANGWLFDLDGFAVETPAWNIDDIVPSVRAGLSHDGSLYAAPIYAESSMLTYRQDVLDNAGVSMPDAPTWDEVAEIARAVDGEQMAGICLRGRPGWGDLGASFTTVLNTFGGTWWAANADGSIGASQVDQPAFRQAVDFYVALNRDAGLDDAQSASFNECLTAYRNGEVAMWYDSTVAGPLLEASGSSARGRNGYALAPTARTDASGWLWAWSLAIPTNAPDPSAAWEYVSWATSEAYFAGRADRFGWETLIGATRRSTFETPAFRNANE
ncbi:MAG: serine/threonine-protein kinase, partial [Actinomycetota bacterium]